MDRYKKKLINALVILCMVTMWFIIPECAYADTIIDVKVTHSSRNGMQYAVSSSGLWLNEAGELSWFGESDFDPILVKTDNSVSHISSGSGGLVYITENAEGQELNIVLPDGTIALDSVHIISDASIVQMEGDLFVLDTLGIISSVYIYDGSLLLRQLNNS